MSSTNLTLKIKYGKCISPRELLRELIDANKDKKAVLCWNENEGGHVYSGATFHKTVADITKMLEKDELSCGDVTVDGGIISIDVDISHYNYSDGATNSCATIYNCNDEEIKQIIDFCEKRKKNPDEETDTSKEEDVDDVDHYEEDEEGDDDILSQRAK
jgi:hypothetical protein